LRHAFLGAMVVLALGACSEDGSGGPAPRASGAEAAIPGSAGGSAGAGQSAGAGESAGAGQSAGAGESGMPLGGAPAMVGPVMEPAGGGAGAPAEAEEPWEILIEGEWELPPGTEGYRCARLTPDEDLYAGALKAKNPPGTHHTVLTIGAPSGADGVGECSAGVNAAEGVFGAGVGTDDLIMPAGVAMRFTAGQQLLLNLHLFNVTDAPLSGVSGTLYRSVAADEVEQLAERTIVVSVSLSLPPGEVTTQQGQCTITQDTTVFALLPHMHQLGVHLKGVVERAGEVTRVLHDAPFDFDTQPIYALDRVQLVAGDVVHTECTYDNTTDQLVTFGDSSLDEMCNFSLFRYPASEGGAFICAF